MLMFGLDVVGSGLNPGQLSGLQLWLDAADSSTITKSSNLVSQINDKSGNGNNATSIGAARPTYNATAVNNKGGLVYAGAQNLQVLSSSFFTFANGNNTLFIVAVPGTLGGATNQLICQDTFGSKLYKLEYTGTNDNISFNSSSADHNLTLTSSDTNPQILTAFRNGTTLSLSKDNAAAVTSSNGANTSGITGTNIGCTAGSSEFYNGTICEVIAYNRALSAAEIIQINQYLSIKWGITIS